MNLHDGDHGVPPGKLASVTTYLEMTSPAPLRGARCPADLVFTEGPNDVVSYRELFRRVGKPWLWFSRLRMDEDDLRAILQNPAVSIHSLVRDGAAEAILELDFREEGACELAFFGLTASLIGTGCGAYLMDRAIELAWDRQIDRFHVHTCSLDSPGALHFYIRSGFSPYKRSVDIADDPRNTGDLPPDAAPHIPRL